MCVCVCGFVGNVHVNVREGHKVGIRVNKSFFLSTFQMSGSRYISLHPHLAPTLQDLSVDTLFA